MLFIENKYRTWYYSIITRAEVRGSINEYSERHHIIPKSLGGNDDVDNLVELTAREHFICHWLLTKMTHGQNKQKMIYACKMMMNMESHGQERYKISSHIYELLRINFNDGLKDRIFTEEWRNRLKISALIRAENETEEQRKNRGKGLSAYNRTQKGISKPHTRGKNNYFYGMRLLGEENGFYGKTHSEETLELLRGPKLKMSCIYCRTVVGGDANLVRWHGDKCPCNPNNPDYDPHKLEIRQTRDYPKKPRLENWVHSSKILVTCLFCKGETRLNQLTRAHGIDKCC